MYYLLNDTYYSYRISALNNKTQFLLSLTDDESNDFEIEPSNWSSEKVNSYNSSLDIVTMIDTTVVYQIIPDEQAGIAADNVIEIYWEPVLGADYYRVYEPNMLIADNIENTYFIDTNRLNETSTFYRYIVTAVKDLGNGTITESAPQEFTFNVSTLPEIEPAIQDNLEFFTAS